MTLREVANLGTLVDLLIWWLYLIQRFDCRIGCRSPTMDTVAAAFKIHVSLLEDAECIKNAMLCLCEYVNSIGKLNLIKWCLFRCQNMSEPTCSRRKGYGLREGRTLLRMHKERHLFLMDQTKVRYLNTKPHCVRLTLLSTTYGWNTRLAAWADGGPGLQRAKELLYGNWKPVI